MPGDGDDSDFDVNDLLGEISLEDEDSEEEGGSSGSSSLAVEAQDAKIATTDPSAKSFTFADPSVNNSAVRGQTFLASVGLEDDSDGDDSVEAAAPPAKNPAEHVSPPGIPTKLTTELQHFNHQQFNSPKQDMQHTSQHQASIEKDNYPVSNKLESMPIPSQSTVDVHRVAPSEPITDKATISKQDNEVMDLSSKEPLINQQQAPSQQSSPTQQPVKRRSFTQRQESPRQRQQYVQQRQPRWSLQNILAEHSDFSSTPGNQNETSEGPFCLGSSDIPQEGGGLHHFPAASRPSEPSEALKGRRPAPHALRSQQAEFDRSGTREDVFRPQSPASCLETTLFPLVSPADSIRLTEDMINPRVPPGPVSLAFSNFSDLASGTASSSQPGRRSAVSRQNACGARSRSSSTEHDFLPEAESPPRGSPSPSPVESRSSSMKGQQPKLPIRGFSASGSSLGDSGPMRSGSNSGRLSARGNRSSPRPTIPALKLEFKEDAQKVAKDDGLWLSSDQVAQEGQAASLSSNSKAVEARRASSPNLPATGLDFRENWKGNFRQPSVECRVPDLSPSPLVGRFSSQDLIDSGPSTPGRERMLRANPTPVRRSSVASISSAIKATVPWPTRERRPSSASNGPRLRANHAIAEVMTPRKEEATKQIDSQDVLKDLAASDPFAPSAFAWEARSPGTGVAEEAPIGLRDFNPGPLPPSNAGASGRRPSIGPSSSPSPMAAVAGGVAEAREKVLKLKVQLNALSSQCDKLESAAGRLTGSDDCAGTTLGSLHAAAMRAASERLSAGKSHSSLREESPQVEPSTEAIERMRRWVSELGTNSRPFPVSQPTQSILPPTVKPLGLRPTPGFISGIASPDHGAGPSKVFQAQNERAAGALPHWWANTVGQFWPEAASLMNQDKALTALPQPQLFSQGPILNLTTATVR